MQFESHDQISALFHWGAINSQIRLKAKINKTSVEFSDTHFQSRTKEKNALAISSNQSEQIDSFDSVKDNFHKTLASMDSESKRPDYWGGYSFTPYYFEFWEVMKIDSTKDMFSLWKRALGSNLCSSLSSFLFMNNALKSPPMKNHFSSSILKQANLV